MNDVLYKTPKGYNIKWSKATNRFSCSCPDYQYRQSKTAHDICKHIFDAIQCGYIKAPVEMMKYKPREFFIPIASLVDDLLDHYQHEICGSWRRNSGFIKDLDVVVLVTNIQDLERIKTLIATVGEIEYGKEKRITAKIRDVQIDFRICDDPNLWGSMILHFTGSKTENIRLRKIAASRGLSLSEYGLVKDGPYSTQIIASKTEQEIYAALGEKYKEPAQR